MDGFDITDGDRATYLRSLRHSLLVPVDGGWLRDLQFAKDQLTRLPILHTAVECQRHERVNRRNSAPGQKPGVCVVPGRLRDTSTYPVVKQNLFQDCNIPEEANLLITWVSWG